MAAATTIPAPTLIGSVPQDFFIEPLRGAIQSSGYLDRFPEQIYSHAPDSNLAILLYTLLGPAGFGWLLREYLQARLEIEDAGLKTVNLDALYANPFGFARLAEETYRFDTNGLLTASQQAQIARSDASYRSRALDFLGAARAGGTVRGVTLAAQSGLGRPVEVIENYRALYDQFSDDPLGIPYVGSTLSTEEVIIIPRNDRPTSAVQTISVRTINTVNSLLPAMNPGALPTTGTFTLTLPLGSAFQSVLGATLSSLTGSLPLGSKTLTLSAPTLLVRRGMQVVVAGAGLSADLISTVVDTNVGAGTVTLSDPASTGVVGAGLIFTDPITTIPLPCNVTNDQMGAALQALSVIGHNNVVVTGGPFPLNPMDVRFTGALADTSIPPLIPNSSLTDPAGDPFVIDVVVDQTGVDADGETASLSPEDLYYLYRAVDRIKPLTTIVTTNPGPGSTRRQVAQSIYSDSQFIQVLRFVTGQTGIGWPPLDSTHWVETSVEHQAPRAVGDIRHHYQNFHNIAGIVTYTEGALLDFRYGIDQSSLLNYPNEHTGAYTAYQQALFPLLAQTAGQQYAIDAQAIDPNPSAVESIAGGTALIDGIYPSDYQNLPGVPKVTASGGLWGSLERASGQEYLEIDLGSVQAVNYLSFEMTHKPYDISVSYDLLDMAPARTFKAVTLLPNTLAQSIVSVGHDVTQSNPWSNVQIYFTNSLGKMIYTRFLRLTLAKRIGESSFTLPQGQTLPFSAEIRNLRVGRNVS